MTPQVRSRLNLTERGYLVSTVESLKQFPDKKKSTCKCCGHTPLISVKVDMWNCFDLVAEHPQKQERIYVQVTDYSSHSKRRNKILGSFEAKLVLLAGAKVLIQSWHKDERINRFVLREEYIELRDFDSGHFYPNTVAELVEIKRKAKKPDLPPGSSLPLGEFNLDETPF